MPDTRRVFSRSEVFDATMHELENDVFAVDVWMSKYALKNAEGEFVELAPSMMHERVARELSRIESKYPNPLSYDEIHEKLSSWKIIPQGSPLAAIGNPYQMQSLSNCFVIPLHDSYASIMRADQELAQIMKRRGGVGLDVSALRPAGCPTANAAKTSAGIMPFLDRFSRTCREVGQNGRRGALMLTISVAHMQVEDFIDAKNDRDKTAITGANMSVKITDEFMRAVSDDVDFTLRWPVASSHVDAKMTKVVKARDVWNKIVRAAHASGEPGILMWDNIIRNSPADMYASVGFETISTNPCAELPLAAKDSCKLMLMNLVKYVTEPFKSAAVFDMDRFSADVEAAQRMMDDVVDLEIEAVERVIKKIQSDPEDSDTKHIELKLWQGIRDTCVRGRRTGLGVTAVGDAIAMLGMKYGSAESIELVNDVYRTLATSAYRSSCKLASERGTFGAFSTGFESDTHPFMKRIFEAAPDVKELWKKHGRRNIACLTTAPAGSMSTLIGTSAGIEPVYRIEYDRLRKINAEDADARVDFVDKSGDTWQRYHIVHRYADAWAKLTGNAVTAPASPYAGSQSSDIDWMSAVELLAAAQKWVDHGISKTVNLPKGTPMQIVNDVYLRAWKLGCKGFTVYVEGSRSGVLISDDAADSPASIVDSRAPRRPKELKCDIHRVTVKGQQHVVLVGLLDSRPYEVFCGLSDNVELPSKIKGGAIVKNGKRDGITTYDLKLPIGDDDYIMIKNVAGQFDNPTYDAFTRTISLALRNGVAMHDIVDQLRKDKHSDVTSFSSVIARVLSKNYVPDETTGRKCESCGSENIVMQQGCLACLDCSFSKCQ